MMGKWFRKRPRRLAKWNNATSVDLTRRLSFRPRLEALEDRLAPALVLNTGVPNPSVFGQAITFTGSGATDGNATTNETIVLIDTASFAVVGHTTFDPSATTGSHGAWTITTSSLASSASAYTLQAVEIRGLGATAQDGNSNTVSQTVNKASTTTTISSTPNPSAFGQVVTFTATVAAVSPGAGAPTGTVNFLEGSTTLASSVALNGSDQATFTTSSLALGTHTVTADYSGDTDFQTSSPTTAVVQTVGAGATTTVVTQPTTNVPASGGTDTFFNQAATFTATVTSTNGSTPTGHVAFLDGTTTLASGVTFFLTSGDKAEASFTTSSLSVVRIPSLPCTPTTWTAISAPAPLPV